MNMRVMVGAFIAALTFGAVVRAQQPTGEIFGRITDQSGAVMPGVTVTLTGPILLQPLVAVASDTGPYQCPRLEVADYISGISLMVAATRSRDTRSDRHR